jgi:hypothetical protein
VEEMRLVNLLCHLVQYVEGLRKGGVGALESRIMLLPAGDRQCSLGRSAYVFNRLREISMYDHHDPGP